MVKFKLAKMIAKFTLLAWLASAGVGVVLAEPIIQFHNLTKKDGLSSSVVFDVAQDKNGFIWLATEDGLQKYDGYNFVNYRHNRLDPNSISSNVVRVLMVDESGVLWVGTDNGLNVYSKKLDNFYTISHDPNNPKSISSNQIRTILQTSDGYIWVGSAAGLSKISPDLKVTKNYSHFKVRAIHEDDHKQLWVGTLGKGVFLFNKFTEKFEPIPNLMDGKRDTQSSLQVVDLYQDAFGRILVATWGNGVYQVKKDYRVLDKYEVDLPSQFVRSIHQDKKGKLWIGTKQGILVYEPAEKISRKIFASDSNETSLKSNNITSFFQGDDNTIWIGTYGGGVSRHYPSSSRFENYGLHRNAEHGLSDATISAMSENRNGQIWLGSETGKIALFDPGKKLFEHYPTEQFEDINNFTIFAIHEVQGDVLLLSTSNGIFKYYYKKNEIQKFTEKESEYLANDYSVNFINIDQNGLVWIGVENFGLSVFNVDEEGAFSEIKELHVELKHPKSLVFPTKNRAVLATKVDGIYHINYSAKNLPEIVGVSLVEGTIGLGVLDINVDWKERVWVATLSNGIKLIKDHKVVNTLDEQNGLPNNNVYSIISDITSNRVWATTNSGLVSINPETLNLTHYTSSDGLQDDEFNSSGLKSSLGYLYFAGVNGFNRFYPNILEEKLYVRPPNIINLFIANKFVHIGQKSDFKKSLLVSSALTLNYNQAPFSLEFTSPQFVKPRQLIFRYRLKGFSDEWIQSAYNVRRATYTNIGSGRYTFEVQVGSKYGGWNQDIKRLELEVLPPWWKTLIAKSVYALFFLCICFSAIYIFRRKRNKEKIVQLALQENEERLKLSLWGSGYEFWDWNLDTSEISRSNQFRRIQIECDRLSKNLRELASYVHPDDLNMVREKLTNHIAGHSKHFDISYRVVDAIDGWRWIQDRGKVVAFDDKGNALRMSGTQRDITEIKQRNEQFDMLGQAFKSTSDGVWIRDYEWKLVECNPAYERITGFPLIEKKGESLWFPDTQEQPENLMQRIRISIEEKGSWQGEAWAERKNNVPFPQKLSIDTLHDEKGNIKYYVGVFSDITFHKRTEEEFRKLANYDSLTGLPNRACLYDRLNQTIEKTKRDKARFALFLIDIDNFKRINDSLGHGVGDTLIRQVSSRIVNCNKEGDTVSRIGGDEFVIVIENIRSSSALATFSELLLKELNQPIFVKGEQLKLNFSIGITLAPDDGVVAERLMRNADTAMYEAKKSVENSYRFYSIEFNERAQKRLQLENELRKAIDDDVIELFYQPKVDLSTGLVEGVEALARWTHRELGFISPNEFIPLAEETGLIAPLGLKLIQQAARQTKQWVDLGIMRGRTSVNLSAHQFWNKNLANDISKILEQEKLPTKYIEFEITESACVQDIEETISQINVLKDLGFTLALDDFGTGYSSLAQLKLLPFDTLKVDKSFVDNIETDKQDAKVVRAIIDIAKTMEMKVVIEGVESKPQCEYLWKNRAYVVQGFYFSRPVRGVLVAELFNRQWHKKEYLGLMAVNVTPLG